MIENNTNCSNSEDSAKLILRLLVAFLMLFHGIAKLQHDIAPMMSMIESHGLPGFIAYGVYIGEIIAPIMLILGFRVKLAAFLIIATIVFALGLVYADKIFTLTKPGGWTIELHMFYIFTCLSIILLGAGRFSLDKK